MFASSSPKIPAQQHDCSQCGRVNSERAAFGPSPPDGAGMDSAARASFCQSEGILPQKHTADLHHQVRGVSQRNLWQANLNQVKGCGSR